MLHYTKPPVITKNLILVCSLVLLVFGAIAYISYRLAVRDAANGVDFGFKWFGASAAIFFALVGPFGMLGLMAMRGEANKGPGFVYRIIFAAFASIALTVWALNKLGAFSLFF